MLVLNRKLGERIAIGPNVVVTVVAVQGERVKLAIEAPREVPIFREELCGCGVRPASPPARNHFGSPYFAECA